MGTGDNAADWREALAAERNEYVEDAIRYFPRPPDPADPAFVAEDGSWDREGWQDRVKVWRRDLARMVQAVRASALDMKDHAQFDHWAPQDSMTVAEALRAVVVHDEANSREPILSGRLSYAVREVLVSQDRLICVPNPDDLFAPPWFEGRASAAGRRMPPGVYDATGIDGRGDYKLVVAPTVNQPGPVISAVFPAWANHASVLSQLAAITTAPHYSEEQMLSSIRECLRDAGWLEADVRGRYQQRVEQQRDVLAERAEEIRQAVIDAPTGPPASPGPCSLGGM